MACSKCGSKPKAKAMKQTTKPYRAAARISPFGSPKVRLSFSSRSR